MKLVIAVVQGEDAQRTVEALTEAGISSTRMASSGGFLQQGNVTLMIGIEDSEVQDTVRIIHENCHERSRYLTSVPPLTGPSESYSAFPVEVPVGGATVFVVSVDSIEKI